MTISRKIDTIPHRIMRYFVWKYQVITQVFFRLFNRKGVFVILGVAALMATLIFNISGALAKTVADRFADELWYLDVISAPQAWDSETGSSQTIVALLDAGFDLDHEDLADQYWTNNKETAGDNTDNDHNGYEDDVMGWDFVDGDADPSPAATEESSDTVISHGTVIAGIIGATANNGKGIVGINWDVSIMPLRVLNENGSGSTKNVRHAIEYAVENGADVINLSFAFTQTDERLRDTIVWAHEQGVVIVAAIGNGDIDTDTQPIYPACFDQEIGQNIIIGVGSTNKLDQKSSFSNFGTSCVDLSAPGEDIFASVYHDADVLRYITSYASPWEGTSLASPMVAGAAALLRSAHPTLTPDQIRNAIKLSVDPVNESSLEARKRLGAGRLNVARALEYAKVFASGGVVSGSAAASESSASFVVSQGRGSEPTVVRVNGRGDVLAAFDAYHPDFHGGVRVAMGDVDGDGESEIITGAGPGGGPQVRIFDLNGNLESQFFAFEEGDRNGIYVTVGDVNADGVDEIIVSSDTGGTGQVRIFTRNGHLRGSFFPHGRTSDVVRIALANVDSDSGQEIVSAHIQDGVGTVAVHDSDGRYIRTFKLTEKNLASVSVNAADLDGDNLDEIIVASGEGSSPRVSIYSSQGVFQKFFFAYQSGFLGGVEVAVGDIDQNGFLEIYTVPQSNGGPHARVFDDGGSAIGGFFPFNKTNRYGTYIAID
jgi:subtilisin family serine protease